LVEQAEATAHDIEALPIIAQVSGETFLQNPLLHEEVFGPYSLMVSCRDEQELIAVLKSVSGQLTTTIMGTEKDLTRPSRTDRPAAVYSPAGYCSMACLPGWRFAPVWYTADLRLLLPIAALPLLVLTR
jgi:hypothetical protein